MSRLLIETFDPFGYRDCRRQAETVHACKLCELQVSVERILDLLVVLLKLNELKVYVTYLLTAFL